MSNSEAVQDFPGEYRLDVEDFGPIAKASVDLRPLTVFIGPSNTGKSYLAVLLYALYQCIGDRPIGPYGRRYHYYDKFVESSFKLLNESVSDSHITFNRLRDWILYWNDNNSEMRLSHGTDTSAGLQLDLNSSTTDRQTGFPSHSDLLVRSTLERTDIFDRNSEREIGRCFGVDSLRLLVRRGSDTPRARIELDVPRSTNAGMVKYELELSDTGIESLISISGRKSLSSEIDALIDPGLAGFVERHFQVVHPPDLNPEDFDERLGYLIADIADEVFKLLITPLDRNAYYLPADRTGIMHSHQVVVSALVQSATTAGLRRSPDIPILSGVLADFLDQLIEMSGNRARGRSRSDRDAAESSASLAKRLERDVLKGAVRMENVGSGYPSFDYLPNGWRDTLPLMRASSMVSELAPVVLYLRHLVRPGDVLIIEEPESHLHPAMQVEFTRQLAALVRAGIRVIVTTHSEWLLQELANLVRASQLPEAERAGIAGGDVALDPSQVGAWLFRPDESEEGSTVSPVGLDESGLYPSDFEDVAVAMHNEWAEISSRLGEDG